MLRHVATGGYGMHVNIENERSFAVIPNQPKRGKAGFFPCFPQGHGGSIRIAVGVTTGLKPAVELAVVNEHNPLAVGADNPGRTGNVAYKQRPLETVGVLLNERNRGGGHGLLMGIGWHVATQRIQELLAVHGLGFR